MNEKFHEQFKFQVVESSFSEEKTEFFFKIGIPDVEKRLQCCIPKH